MQAYDAAPRDAQLEARVSKFRNIVDVLEDAAHEHEVPVQFRRRFAVQVDDRLIVDRAAPIHGDVLASRREVPFKGARAGADVDHGVTRAYPDAINRRRSDHESSKLERRVHRCVSVPVDHVIQRRSQSPEQPGCPFLSPRHANGPTRSRGREFEHRPEHVRCVSNVSSGSPPACHHEHPHATAEVSSAALVCRQHRRCGAHGRTSL